MTATGLQYLADASDLHEQAATLTVLADEILTNALARPLHDPRHDAGLIVARKLREAANALTDAADEFILRAGDYLDVA